MTFKVQVPNNLYSLFYKIKDINELNLREKINNRSVFSYRFKQEVQEWLDTNIENYCTESYDIDDGSFNTINFRLYLIFNTNEEAILFKLQWC